MPRNHIRNVHTGSDGSSLVGTVSRTCSIGDCSSSSMVGLSCSLLLGGAASVSKLPMIKRERLKAKCYFVVNLVEDCRSN